MIQGHQHHDHDHDHDHDRRVESKRYEGLVPLWDNELKYPKIVGYVHAESRTLFDEKHRFSSPTKPGLGLAAMLEVNPKHMRRIKLATELLGLDPEEDESQS